eukprot:5717111-Prymnesium_polylepis.1
MVPLGAAFVLHVATAVRGVTVFYVHTSLPIMYSHPPRRVWRRSGGGRGAGRGDGELEHRAPPPAYSLRIRGYGLFGAQTVRALVSRPLR